MISLKRFYISTFALLFFVLCAASHSMAQTNTLRLPRPSQKASAMQTIGVTDITITYSRPGVKNRKIWGDPPAGSVAGTATLDDARSRAKDAPIVPYGHVWRTGANEATLFEVSDNVLINGQPLAAGRYSFHTIPGKDEWTIIFNKDDGQWGSFAYDEKKDVLRVKAKPEMVAENQEWLAISFDPVTENSARVNIRWERLRVPFTVEVKDVNALAIEKARSAIAASKPDDWQSRMQAANFAFQSKLNMEEAMQWLDQSIKIKETFNNVGLKARVLAEQGKTADAVAAGEKAIQLGKEAKANPQAIANMEKLVSDWKAKK
ncbi:MAG: DUF2911 domain-containing protein [Acidobacteria bacterium]|nr:DUF2911 domain-containing protein [Acidobacteriota bacterium]